MDVCILLLLVFTAGYITGYRDRRVKHESILGLERPISIKKWRRRRIAKHSSKTG